MILKAPSSNVMNKLERSVLAMYSYDPTPDSLEISNVMRQCITLIGSFPTIVAHAYAVKRHVFNSGSLYIHNPKKSLSVAQDFLRMLRKHKHFSDEEAKILDIMLILHAEHGGGNNSTFACRTLTSSGTDTYSAIAAAVGSLKGPLHGGANAKVREMLNYIKSATKSTSDKAIKKVLEKILDKKGGDGSGKLYGLGHAIYTMSDPRTEAIRKYARKLIIKKGLEHELEIAEKVESIGIPMVMERTGRELPMCANVDLYSGLVYQALGIPEDLFTPLFAIARISGWCAHRLEEIISGGRIIRPAYRALTIKDLPYIPLKNRK
jgi:citrate synthase